MDGQVLVQMRVPEISLDSGLQAQNKHDLCRYSKYKRQPLTNSIPYILHSLIYGGAKCAGMGLDKILNKISKNRISSIPTH